MSCIIADLLGLNKNIIGKDLSAAQESTGPLLRPMNAQLETAYSYELIQFQPIMQFKDSIKDCLENFII